MNLSPLENIFLFKGDKIQSLVPRGMGTIQDSENKNKLDLDWMSPK